MASLARRPEYDDRALGGAERSTLGLSAPHDVYTLGLDELAEGNGLEAAKAVGRRVLIMDAKQPVATAELSDPDGAGGVAANEGPFTESTASTIEKVESWPVVADGDYELRVLRLPALYLMALWLKDEAGNADLLVPLYPAPRGIEPGRGYTEEELLRDLRERATSRHRTSDERSS